MTRSKLWLFPVLGLSLSACAGDLKQPERFEVSQGAASAAPEDAGSKDTKDDDKEPSGGSDAGASACGSTTALLKAKCGTAGCHGAVGGAAGLDLATDGLAARLKDLPSSAACEGYAQIDSKDPGQSLIYLKVTDTPPCAPRMPIGTPLSDTEQACLLEWLEQL